MDERQQEIITRDTAEQKEQNDAADVRETIALEKAVGDILGTPIITTTSLEKVITDENVNKHVLYPEDIELPPDAELLVDPLAAYVHNSWSNWMLWLFRFGEKNRDGTFTIQADRVERWERQMNTLYQFLSEEEQELDREEAREILKILYKLLM